MKKKEKYKKYKSFIIKNDVIGNKSLWLRLISNKEIGSS